MELKPFQEKELPLLLALQNRLAPARRRMSESLLRESLLDSSRGFGAQARVAWHNGQIKGFAAWVRGENGESFGSPVVAESEGATRVLVEALEREVQGASWLRISAFPEEPKVLVLPNAGFSPLFEFVEFEQALRPGPVDPVLAGVRESCLLDCDPEEFRALHNGAFAGVDNSLPFDEAGAREVLASPTLDRRFSLLWRDSAGRPLAYCLALSDGYVDSIGVAPDAQGKGHGTLLYRRLIGLMAKAGLPRAFSTVSSRNESSLRLHRRLAMPEVERRKVWQKILGK